MCLEIQHHGQCAEGSRFPNNLEIRPCDKQQTLFSGLATCFGDIEEWHYRTHDLPCCGGRIPETQVTSSVASGIFSTLSSFSKITNIFGWLRKQEGGESSNGIEQPPEMNPEETNAAQVHRDEEEPPIHRQSYRILLDYERGIDLETSHRDSKNADEDHDISDAKTIPEEYSLIPNKDPEMEQEFLRTPQFDIDGPVHIVPYNTPMSSVDPESAPAPSPTPQAVDANALRNDLANLAGELNVNNDFFKAIGLESETVEPTTAEHSAAADMTKIARKHARRRALRRANQGIIVPRYNTRSVARWRREALEAPDNGSLSDPMRSRKAEAELFEQEALDSDAGLWEPYHQPPENIDSVVWLPHQFIPRHYRSPLMTRFVPEAPSTRRRQKKSLRRSKALQKKRSSNAEEDQ